MNAPVLSPPAKLFGDYSRRLSAALEAFEQVVG